MLCFVQVVNYYLHHVLCIMQDVVDLMNFASIIGGSGGILYEYKD